MNCPLSRRHPWLFAAVCLIPVLQSRLPADRTAPLTVESVHGEGVWVDPALVKLAPRATRVTVTIWFDRQLLGDGQAYLRRSREFSKWKRSDLRKAAMATLKKASLTSRRQAASRIEELVKAGKLSDLEWHWIVNGFTATVATDSLDQLKTIPGVKKIFARRQRGRLPARALPAPRFFDESPRPPFDAARYRHPWYARYLLADRVWRELGVTGRGTLNVVHDFNFVFCDNVTRNLYRNAGETAGNGKDDDGNGLVDDVHGYNFDAGSPALTTSPLRGGRVAMGQLHGMMCASIICGVGSPKVPFEFGLAPEAQWAAVIASRRLEAAIEWAVEQGADTYSMSFSIPALGEYRSHWRKVMEHGSLCGIYFVSGAGNFAQSAPIPVQMRTPEDIPEVVFAAAGVQRDLSRTPFSSKGPVAWATEHYRDGRVAKPEVCAFNAGLPALLPDGRILDVAANGNSFAGPMFCGTIALMLSADPELLPWDLKQIITSTATDVAAPGVDDETGHGLINCYRAVKEVLRRKALREGRDPSPFAPDAAQDRLNVDRIRKLAEKSVMVVARVQPGSQAASVGLKRGDVLLRFAGKDIHSRADLRNARAGKEGKGKLTVRRGDKELVFDVGPGRLGIVAALRFPEPVFQ